MNAVEYSRFELSFVAMPMHLYRVLRSSDTARQPRMRPLLMDADARGAKCVPAGVKSSWERKLHKARRSQWQ